MDFVTMSIFGSIIGTVLMILIYLYLYLVYRDRYFGYWIVSWLFLFLRNILFDSGLLPWRESLLWFSSFQALTFIVLIIFVKGTYLLMGKQINRRWLYYAGSAYLLSIIFGFLDLSFFYRLLPATSFGGIVGIWLGITFIKHVQLNSMSKYLLGYGFILWGLHFLDMPFLINIPGILPWGYLVESLIRLMVAIATLLVYFEKTRADLVQKEAQYRLLAENAVDIIYRYQLLPTAKFEYTSPSIYPVTGYTPEEYYEDANLFFSLVHPDDAAQFHDFIHDYQFKGQPYSFRLIRKDKSTIWVEQTCVPIYTADGQITALEGILRDITSRKNLEQIALRADRLNTVGEMAASVAHEIRNPMTTVRGYLQLLLCKKDFLHYRDRFELMIQELDRTNDIIREYLCLAKDKHSDLKRCCLNRIVQSLLPLIRADASAFSVEVKDELSDIPQLWLDENEIRQLLLNLVRNGLEAMPSGGILQIRTFLENGNAVLAVSDQGSGIPEHVFNNLGTPFLTTKDNGTGLGLPMCYRIAHRHQSEIKVETGNLGTTFYICFKIPS